MRPTPAEILAAKTDPKALEKTYKYFHQKFLSLVNHRFRWFRRVEDLYDCFDLIFINAVKNYKPTRASFQTYLMTSLINSCKAVIRQDYIERQSFTFEIPSYEYEYCDEIGHLIAKCILNRQEKLIAKDYFIEQKRKGEICGERKKSRSRVYRTIKKTRGQLKKLI